MDAPLVRLELGRPAQLEQPGKELMQRDGRQLRHLLFGSGHRRRFPLSLKDQRHFRRRVFEQSELHKHQLLYLSKVGLLEQQQLVAPLEAEALERRQRQALPVLELPELRLVRWRQRWPDGLQLELLYQQEHQLTEVFLKLEMGSRYQPCQSKPQEGPHRR